MVWEGKAEFITGARQEPSGTKGLVAPGLPAAWVRLTLIPGGD